MPLQHFYNEPRSAGTERVSLAIMKFYSKHFNAKCETFDVAYVMREMKVKIDVGR